MKPRIERFAIHGTIDEKVSARFSEFHQYCLTSNVTHVILEIHTDGGDCGCMNSIISAIEHPSIEYHGFVAGFAYSAGICILRACDYAYATETADIMFHDDVVQHNGTLDGIRHELRHERARSDREIKRFARKTNKDWKWWKKKGYGNRLQEFLLTPQQALKYGVIDYIGQPKLTVKKKYSVKSEVV